MSPLPAGAEALVEWALAEDIGPGDLTTAWTMEPDARGEAWIVTRAEGVIAGAGVTGAVFNAVDADLELTWSVGEGVRVATGGKVVRVCGRLASIVTAERTALNFLGRLSGIATTAARYVEAVSGTGVRVVDTRKTTPGWRALEKAASAAGGVTNHRMGLYDMILIKENHARAAGGVASAVRRVKPRAVELGLEVEVEVTDLDELEAVLPEEPDRVLLDNMSPEELARAVARVREYRGRQPLLEASGGVTLETIGEVARAGVDLISVGAITHSAPVLDLSLQVTE